MVGMGETGGDKESCNEEEETEPDVKPEVDPEPESAPSGDVIGFKDGAIESRDVDVDKAPDFRMKCTSLLLLLLMLLILLW